MFTSLNNFQRAFLVQIKKIFAKVSERKDFLRAFQNFERGFLFFFKSIKGFNSGFSRILRRIWKVQEGSKIGIFKNPQKASQGHIFKMFAEGPERPQNWIF